MSGERCSLIKCSCAHRAVRDEAVAAERTRCARIAREYGAEKSSTIYGTANAVGVEIAELLVKA